MKTELIISIISVFGALAIVAIPAYLLKDNPELIRDNKWYDLWLGISIVAAVIGFGTFIEAAIKFLLK